MKHWESKRMQEQFETLNSNKIANDMNLRIGKLKHSNTLIQILQNHKDPIFTRAHSIRFKSNITIDHKEIGINTGFIGHRPIPPHLKTQKRNFLAQHIRLVEFCCSGSGSSRLSSSNSCFSIDRPRFQLTRCAIY